MRGTLQDLKCKICNKPFNPYYRHNCITDVCFICDQRKEVELINKVPITIDEMLTEYFDKYAVGNYPT